MFNANPGESCTATAAPSCSLWKTWRKNLLLFCSASVYIELCLHLCVYRSLDRYAVYLFLFGLLGGVLSSLLVSCLPGVARQIAGRQAFPAGPQHCNSGGADGAGVDGFVFSVPSDNCKEKRRDKNGNCGDSDTCSILCGLAQGMGGLPYGKGGLGGGQYRRCKSQTPERDGISYRRTQ